MGKQPRSHPADDGQEVRQIWQAAIGLALAAAVSLGMARFSYALLLPAMREELGWTYLTAGAMNTANAAGYLAGALLMPRLLRRFDARAVLLAGGAVAGLLMALHGLPLSEAALYGLRAATGMASAASFVTGGLLAARLAAGPAAPVSGSPGLRPGLVSSSPGLRPGLVLGLYYGGTGLGIIGSTLVVPPLDWRMAWVALGGLCGLATLATAWGTRRLVAPPAPGAPRGPVQAGPLAFGLAGYLLFGLGYIGYMTFVITLLREQGLGDGARMAFYALLGVGVIASSWLWAGLLQRWRGGQTLALLNGLLALATVLPVLSSSVVAVFVSGALFGSVFLSVVASTTALVRHNLPPSAWPGGIALFTVVFAGGQIVGPALVGWVSDGVGGLLRGFAVSAALLAAGSLLALGQRPLPQAERGASGSG